MGILFCIYMLDLQILAKTRSSFKVDLFVEGFRVPFYLFLKLELGLLLVASFLTNSFFRLVNLKKAVEVLERMYIKCSMKLIPEE